VKKLANSLLKYIAVYIILIIIFTVSLTLVCLIPSKIMRENVSESADTLFSEGNYVYFDLVYTWLILDNYTDALMINTAYSIDNTTPLYSALTARKNYIPGKTKFVHTDTIYELKSASKYDVLNQVGELKDTVSEDIDESFEYARYWHGYLTYLRPLLIFLNYGNIRSVFIMMFFMLGFGVIYMLYKKTNIVVALIFLNALLAIEYLLVGMTMQSSSMFFIAIGASIYILLRFEKQKDFAVFFFIIGALTSYFDLTSVPLVTLGVPLIIYFILMQNKKELSLGETVTTVFKFCITWGLAYAIIWFSKWLLVDLLYNKDVIQSSILQLVYRSAGKRDNVEISFMETLFQNYLFIRNYIKFLLIQCFAILIYLKIKNKRVKISLNINDLLPYLIIIFMCPAWYYLARQHSFQHALFTYRLQVVTIIAVQIIIVKILGIYNQKRKS